MRSSRALVALALIAALYCASGLPAAAGRRAQASARYLFSWSGDEDRQDSDFLAVIDLKRDGDRYGTVVATLPVGEKGLWPPSHRTRTR